LCAPDRPAADPRWLADALARAGSATPLKWVLLTFDGLTALALVGYLGASRHLRRPSESAQ
jgi:hypothetical protein